MEDTLWKTSDVIQSKVLLNKMWYGNQIQWCQIVSNVEKRIKLLREITKNYIQFNLGFSTFSIEFYSNEILIQINVI